MDGLARCLQFQVSKIRTALMAATAMCSASEPALVGKRPPPTNCLASYLARGFIRSASIPESAWSRSSAA